MDWGLTTEAEVSGRIIEYSKEKKIMRFLACVLNGVWL